MKQEELKFAIRGTLVHAPAAGDIEVLDDALIAVSNGGQIAAVSSPGQPDYVNLEQTAKDAGKLEVLSAGEYLLPAWWTPTSMRRNGRNSARPWTGRWTNG